MSAYCFSNQTNVVKWWIDPCSSTQISKNIQNFQALHQTFPMFLSVVLIKRPIRQCKDNVADKMDSDNSYKLLD